MYTETVVMIVLVAGILIGLMAGVMMMSIPKTHGKWQYTKAWLVVDLKGNIIRAQFEHPTQGIKDSEKILKTSRGGNFEERG